MKQLIIYSHPNPASFNHAILETARETLTAKGDEVIVRDLYALNFDPVLKGSDFEKLMSGQTTADIKTEQGPYPVGRFTGLHLSDLVGRDACHDERLHRQDIHPGLCL